MSPLSSVLGGYVYNSLLTGRPYFLQLMDDLQIAARFIRSRPANDPVPITLSGVGEASSLARWSPSSLPNAASPRTKALVPALTCVYKPSKVLLMVSVINVTCASPNKKLAPPT